LASACCGSSLATTPATSETTTVSSHFLVCAAEDVNEIPKLPVDVKNTVDIIDLDGGEIQDANLEGTLTQTDNAVQVVEGVCKDQMDFSWMDKFSITDDYLKSFSTDKLLGHIDNNPIDEYGLLQSLDFGQIGSPKESNNPHVGITSSFFYELENRDAMLSGSFPHTEHTASGVDYGLPLNFNGEEEDTPFLDLDYDLNHDSRGMQGKKNN